MSFDVKRCVDWLQRLTEPDSTVEFRAIYEKRSVQVAHVSAQDRPLLEATVSRISAGARGVYWLLNPLPADWASGNATDASIVKRRWLFIDCDPRRPADISASHTEKELAWHKLEEVRSFLEEALWPEPVVCDSGNGFHLLYRIDMPSDDGCVVRRILDRLSKRFSTADVKIDTTVFNASRICKLYGTLSAKGESTAERPHRYSKVISWPDHIDVVSNELLHLQSGPAVVADLFSAHNTTEAPKVAAESLPVGTNPELPAGLPADGKMVHGDGRHAELRDEASRTWRRRVEEHGEACLADPVIFENALAELDQWQRTMFAVPVEISTIRRYTLTGLRFITKVLEEEAKSKERARALREPNAKKWTEIVNNGKGDIYRDGTAKSIAHQKLHALHDLDNEEDVATAFCDVETFDKAKSETPSPREELLAMFATVLDSERRGRRSKRRVETREPTNNETGRDPHSWTVKILMTYPKRFRIYSAAWQGCVEVTAVCYHGWRGLIDQVLGQKGVSLPVGFSKAWNGTAKGSSSLMAELMELAECVMPEAEEDERYSVAVSILWFFDHNSKETHELNSGDLTKPGLMNRGIWLFKFESMMASFSQQGWNYEASKVHEVLRDCKIEAKYKRGGTDRVWMHRADAESLTMLKRLGGRLREEKKESIPA